MIVIKWAWKNRCCPDKCSSVRLSNFIWNYDAYFLLTHTKLYRLFDLSIVLNEQFTSERSLILLSCSFKQYMKSQMLEMFWYDHANQRKFVFKRHLLSLACLQRFFPWFIFSYRTFLWLNWFVCDSMQTVQLKYDPLKG